MKDSKPRSLEGILSKLANLSDEEILSYRAAIDITLKQRKLPFNIGQVGEKLVLDFFNSTPGLTNLQPAPTGTKNVDALSRNGDRYSIKTVCNAKKTGTIYPDSLDAERQLFEYLLIVRLSEAWGLESIHQLTWEALRYVRSWDKRMNAWYVAISGRALAAATVVFKAERGAET